MIAFIKGGMTFLMGRITRDYLINHRLCPHQCTPNMFRVIGCIDALNEHIQLGLTWHNIVHLYECHSQADRGFYLKSRSPVVRLISCLPKSNKWMKDDYLITSRAWHNGLHCPTQEKESGKVSQSQVPQQNTSDFTILVIQLLFSIWLYLDDGFS